MTHVTDELLRPLVERFGRPVEWDGSREITDRDAAAMRAATEPDRHHDVTFAVLDGAGNAVAIRKPRFPPGAWRIPSGGIRPGESFAAGTLREALEETGLEIELTGYPLVARSVFTHAAGPDPWTTHVVTARVVSGTLRPRDTVEIEAARWMGLDELTGPVAAVLRGSGGRLFEYRADLHDRIAALLPGA
jgi:ADP-ribose pyrophosphatase YjhB (NUDIX family)